MRVVLALVGAAMLPAGAAPAQSQGDVDAAPGREDVRAALAVEIARMKAEIAGIERLMRWQQDLTRTARTDRAEALRQRLPMSDCRESAMAPLCDDLAGLFRPEDADGASDAGRMDPDPRDIEGEGAR